MSNKYGLCVRSCGCGWMTARKHPNVVCEACGANPGDPNAGSEEFREDVACVIATIAEQKSRKCDMEAKRHGYSMVQVSPRKFIVVRDTGTQTYTFAPRTGKPGPFVTGWADLVHGPADKQSCYRFVRDKTSPIPEHLHGK